MSGIFPAAATAVNGCRRTFGYRSALPRPLASRRSDAPSSLLASLVSPDDAAPLSLAPSVGEMAGAGQVHGDPGVPGRDDGLRVADRAAGLHDRPHTGLDQHLQPVREG